MKVSGRAGTSGLFSRYLGNEILHAERSSMFYVLEPSKTPSSDRIDLGNRGIETFAMTPSSAGELADYAEADIEIVDDSLLNTAPHNRIERQLLTGDMIGLAIMSGAIIWSAMGAIA